MRVAASSFRGFTVVKDLFLAFVLCSAVDVDKLPSVVFSVDGGGADVLFATPDPLLEPSRENDGDVGGGGGG